MTDWYTSRSRDDFLTVRDWLYYRRFISLVLADEAEDKDGCEDEDTGEDEDTETRYGRLLRTQKCVAGAEYECELIYLNQ